MLGKNALWIAISSTLAASCLFAAVMVRENQHKPSTSGVDLAVDALVSQTGSQLDAQEGAAEAFVGTTTSGINAIKGCVTPNCKNIREAAGAKRALNVYE